MHSLSAVEEPAGEAPLWRPESACIGAMVPKRWAKRAVTRNLIKRQIYSLAETYATSFPATAHVVRLSSAFDAMCFKSASSDHLKQAVRAEIEQLFTRAKVNASSPS